MTCTRRTLPRGVMPPAPRMTSCRRCIAIAETVPGRSTSPETTTSNARGEATATLTSENRSRVRARSADLTVGFEERETADADGAERRDVDGPLRIDDHLQARDVEAAGDLHLEHVPVAEPIVGAGDAPDWTRRGCGPLGRAPGWVGSDAGDWVAVDDWVLELADGCAAARDRPEYADAEHQAQGP